MKKIILSTHGDPADIRVFNRLLELLFPECNVCVSPPEGHAAPYCGPPYPVEGACVLAPARQDSH